MSKPESEVRITQQAVLLNNYGTKCLQAKQFGLAEIVFRRLIAESTEDFSIFHSNLGVALLHQNKLGEAVHHLQTALNISPDNAKVLGNLGVANARLDDYEQAITALDKAVEIAPNDAVVRWNRVNTHLSFGFWQEACKDYHWRTKAVKGYQDNLQLPAWDGESDLNTKTLYLQFEQGIGDRILFSRYAYWLKARYPACEIVAVVRDSLIPLLWEFQERGVMRLLPEKTPLPKADYRYYVSSLMFQHNSYSTKVPKDPGLILDRVKPVAAAITESFPTPLSPSLKVGVCWTGDPSQDRNRDRSVPLELMLQLAELPNVTLYSLQTGSGANDVIKLGAQGLLHTENGLGADLEDSGLHLTGAVILNLDLVVTVCTSVAHLAGALGSKVWTLLCSDPYWIWGRSGVKTPWYPSMSLFRQERPGEWQPVIDKVKAMLSEGAANEHHGSDF